MEANAFSWLIDGQLAACVDPTAGRQAAAELQRGGVRLLINLHEKPDSTELLAQLGAETLHLPVISSYAPTQAQLDAGVAAIRESLERGEPVAVHCGAGLGRTGTLLAAYLVSQGQTAEEAMEVVRAVRPGSVETLEQEQAIYEYARRLRSA
ncbi:MAG: dual specificity protein phosphatase family protein [Chloroflexi bacterium]|nr:dual specificity protein phosphatase family protein [Chloroflexota bacterium]MBV9600079.1 dual specificity protein phosphatase family protein [Chloroflexota bacterium]